MIDRYVVWTPAQLSGLVPLCTAQYPPSSIVVHHTAGGAQETPQGIHDYHASIGYGGIGYHFVIDHAGDVWRGRPVWAKGAHCRQNNAGRIGVALMGDFNDAPPPPEMIRGLLRILEDIQQVYGRLDLLPHYAVPRSSTTCPGRACMQALAATGIRWAAV